MPLTLSRPTTSTSSAPQQTRPPGTCTIMLTLSLCTSVETPTKGRGRCSRITVSLTARYTYSYRVPVTDITRVVGGGSSIQYCDVNQVPSVPLFKKQFQGQEWTLVRRVQPGPSWWPFPPHARGTEEMMQPLSDPPTCRLFDEGCGPHCAGTRRLTSCSGPTSTGRTAGSAGPRRTATPRRRLSRSRSATTA